MIESEMTAVQIPEGEVPLEEQIGYAVNKHIVAKNTPNLDRMRQEDAMRDLLALAQTREGLAALIASQS